jgi:hypothetical protein
LRRRWAFLRATKTLRFWALGYHLDRAPEIDGARYLILTIGVGPYRFQFIDFASRWERPARGIAA